jgi:hypothetical protein
MLLAAWVSSELRDPQSLRNEPMLQAAWVILILNSYRNSPENSVSTAETQSTQRIS